MGCESVKDKLEELTKLEPSTSCPVCGEDECDDKPKEHVMEFLNPVFNKGVNLTVRNGIKWAYKVAPDDILLLKKTGCDEVVARARVFGAYMTEDFTNNPEMPETWLALEHDPECRTIEGLTAAMDRAYGKGNWGEKVVAVFFLVD